MSGWSPDLDRAYAAGDRVRRRKEREVEADHVAKMRGHDVTARGHTLGHEVGMGEIGIKQQDIDLDKAAWDFAQNRYDQFGQHHDQMGLAQNALVTRGQMQDFGMDPSEDFWGPYAGMFEEGAPEFGPGVTARQRRPTQRTPGIYSRGDAADMEGIPTIRLPGSPQMQQQSPGGGLANIATPRPAEGQSQFKRDWNAAYDWFGDTFNLPEVEDFIRRAPGNVGRGIRDYFTR